MQTLSHLTRLTLPGDVVMTALRLYRELGRGEQYDKLLKADFSALWKAHAHREANAFYKCFFASWKVLDSRQRTLLLDSTVAKNKAESLYKNIVRIFEQIHAPKASPFMLGSVEIGELVKILYYDVYGTEKTAYQKLSAPRPITVKSTEPTSKRELCDQLVALRGKLRKESESEPLLIDTAFLVDFVNMELFKLDDHEPVAILLWYILAIQSDVTALRYVSFFETMLTQTADYKAAYQKVRLHWTSGGADVVALYRWFLQILLTLSDRLYVVARDYEYETQLEITKTDYIENTIDKLDDTFSKDDIREKHPLISDSTINRTLKRLQEEEKIRPLGKGRSAKWIKLYKKPSKKGLMTQLGLDLGDEA